MVTEPQGRHTVARIMTENARTLKFESFGFGEGWLKRLTKGEALHNMGNSAQENSTRLYTIGHSNHELAAFLQLLKTHGIQVVVDVRSYPYSRYARQFDSPDLRKAMVSNGIKYLNLGKELGGRPSSSAFYDNTGHVRYDMLARSSMFLKAIRRLQSGLVSFRIAVMCSEEDPRGCHRRLLIARVLSGEGVAIYHIRGNGQVQSEDELAAAESRTEDQGMQLSLPNLTKEEPWRSAKPIRSALQNGEQRNSSEH